MLRQSRFVWISALIGLIVCLAFLAITNISPGFAQSAATPAATSGAAQGDPARGKYLVQLIGCAMCHGTQSLAANGEIPLAGGRQFKSTQFGTIYSFNLTTLQNWTDQDFDKAIRQGIQPRSNRVLAPFMPYGLYHNLSDTDLASIAAYIRSLTPVKNDVPPADLGAAMKTLKPLPAESIAAPQAGDNADNGRYLVEVVGNCELCHSPRDASGVVKGRELSGGRRNFGTPENPLYPPAIIGSVLSAEGYDVQNFIATFRTGTRPRGAPLANAMPWRKFSIMTDTDLTAVWNYLQTKKLDSPWPVQTAAPTAAAQPPAAGTPASTPAR